MTHAASIGPLMAGSFGASCTIRVGTHPGAIQFTRPLGAIFTISLLSVVVKPYIIATHISTQHWLVHDKHKNSPLLLIA
jgi:hypothetical protein